jgi:hypothetical protein
MHRQQLTEDFRFRCHASNGAFAQPAVPCKHQNQFAHARGAQSQFSMRAFIPPQIACFHGVGERKGLAKTQPKAFARNRIYAPGRITHQRCISVNDTPQAVHESDRPSLAAPQLCGGKPRLKPRPIPQGGVKISVGGARSRHNDADFFARKGRDVCLSTLTPVDLHEF